MAADATGEAAAQQAETQRETLAQQERLSAPYRQFGEQFLPQYGNLIKAGIGPQGETARNQMMRLLGIGPQGQVLNPTAMQNALRQTPGYQFAQQQGNAQTKAQAAAMGLALSGNTLQALSKFNQGLADQTYQNQLANYQTAYSGQFNARQSELQNLLAPINIGQAAAANQASNVGQVGTNLANIYGAQGQNQANAELGMTGGVANAIGGGVNNYITQNTLRGLTDTGAVGAAYRPEITDMSQYYGPQVFAR
jgi:hypothetical protein